MVDGERPITIVRAGSVRTPRCSRVRSRAVLVSLGSLACGAIMTATALAPPAAARPNLGGSEAARGGMTRQERLTRSFSAGDESFPTSAAPASVDAEEPSSTRTTLFDYTRMLGRDGTLIYTNRPDDQARRERPSDRGAEPERPAPQP